VTLYDADPRPESPIDFAIDFFGSTPRAAVEAAVAENARLKEEIKAAEARIAEIQKEFEDAD
jgi:exonuclease VII large subunit